MPNVTFSFDPVCPWTWKTSRWLLSVAPDRDLTIDWRAFSLAIANEDNMTDEHRERLGASSHALRLVEWLRGRDRAKDIERFYEAIGERVHEDGRDLDHAVLVEAADAAGISEATDVLDDASLDAKVRESHEAAFAAAGPDIGSPVIQIEGHERGVHGPIIEEGLAQKDAVALWDVVARVIPMDDFFEIKRGRGSV